MRPHCASSRSGSAFPGDAFEQEADRIAERVARGANVASLLPQDRVSPAPHIQRMCSACAERVDHPDGAVQAQPSAGEHRVQPDGIAPPSMLPGRGQPLSEPARTFFEPRLGFDISGVRVHTDAAAANSARRIDALAYTVGTDIFFAAGQYSPTTAAGHRLLAHELAHVGQQRSPRSKPGDPQLAPIWKQFAEAFARSTGGLAVEAGADALQSLTRIVDSYTAANTDGRYACIRAIELFGHGSPGAALDRKFTAADFETQQVLATAPRGGGGAGPPTTVFKNVALGEQITKLRGMLCGTSFVHFRSCETFKGAAGAEFAKRVSSALGSYAVGHTQIIDAQLPGRVVYGPGGQVVPQVPVTALPAAVPAAQLPFRYFLIRADLTRLDQQKVLQAFRVPDVLESQESSSFLKELGIGVRLVLQAAAGCTVSVFDVHHAVVNHDGGTSQLGAGLS